MISHGDFNGDSYNDIVVASNPWFFWGVLYNDGTGNFSLPVYYDTEFPIMDIAVGDINGDSIDDILFGGYHLEIHYGTPTGFDYQFLDFYRGHVELFDIDFDGDQDILLAMAGKVSVDLREIICKRPQLFAELIRQLKEVPDQAVLRIVREVTDDVW